MKIRTNVLENPLPALEIIFTHSERKVRKIMQKLGGSCEAWDAVKERSNATTSILEAPGSVVYLIWMKPMLDYSAAVDAALLVHEAVHVKRDYFKSFGEGEVGEETEAYVVQAISEYLIDKHFRWKQKKLGN